MSANHPSRKPDGTGKPDSAAQARWRQKASIRKEILEKRRSQDPDIRAAHSRSIIQTLLDCNAFQAADRVLIYLSKNGEVDTNGLLNRAFDMGKRVYVPVVDPESDELRISELPGPHARFQLGSFGIREPIPEELNFVSPDEMDLVVTPGLAFDRRGGRIGYGKGYYDRLFRRLGSRIPRIALAFGFQVLESVPENENDLRVDAIITEKSVMTCSGT